MTELQQSLFTGVLLTAVGITVTHLVGRKTDQALNRFIKEIAMPMQAAVNKMQESVNGIPQSLEFFSENIRSLRGQINDLLMPLREVALNLGSILQELRGRK